jgi:phosphohistidine phosphatase
MQLLLIRHSKSSWDFNLEDKNRPLSERGIIDANKVFTELFNLIDVNDFNIISSNSERTLLTASIFASVFKLNINTIHFINELYTFDLLNFEKVIKENFTNNLIVFGHNNALTDFVNKYSEKYFENIPTSGVVILKFVDRNIKPKSAVVHKTLFPKDLR